MIFQHDVDKIAQYTTSSQDKEGSKPKSITQYKNELNGESETSQKHNIGDFADLEVIL